jgi:metal-dependent amidase/aminoacylase/carboxypeptidase family protein
MKEFVKSITSPYEKELIETRRYLHRHPELSFQETDTAAYIRSTLNALGVPLMDLRNQHGRCHKRRKNRSMHRVPRGHRRTPGGGRK